MNDNLLKTAVAFFIFNRPECTKKVFAAIREARPERLYLIADGPRPYKNGETEKCKETRLVVEAMVDWPCTVEKNYAETNMGCRARMESGISWVLNHEEDAIILEDDCLPDPSFFSFCATMLERYRDCKEVLLICGTNRMQYKPKDNTDFFFSRFPQIWGWATWRHAWQQHDATLSQWPKQRENKLLNQCDLPPEACSFYYSRIDDVYYKGLDTWDYGWFLTVSLRQGKTIIPAKNLIQNIGFGLKATHTMNPLKAYTLPRRNRMLPPYRAPDDLRFCNAHDERYSRKQFANKSALLRERLFMLLFHRHHPQHNI